MNKVALLSPLGSSAGYKVQGVGKSRGVKPPALSFSGVANLDHSKLPELLILPTCSFYLVTPSGDDSLSFQDAVGDLLEMSTWFVAVFATSEKKQRHMHYVVAMSSHNDSWLSQHPTIFRSGRRIPCVTYSRGSGGGCSLTFAKITNLEGLKNYLEGPRNRSRFVVLLDPSPRTVWQREMLLIPQARGHEGTGGDLVGLFGRYKCRQLLVGMNGAILSAIVVQFCNVGERFRCLRSSGLEKCRLHYCATETW